MDASAVQCAPGPVGGEKSKRAREDIDPAGSRKSEVIQCSRKFGKVGSRGEDPDYQWQCPLPRLPGLPLCQKHHAAGLARRLKLAAQRRNLKLQNSKQQKTCTCLVVAGTQDDHAPRDSSDTESDGEDTDPAAALKLSVEPGGSKESLVEEERERKRQAMQRLPARPQEKPGPAPAPSRRSTSRGTHRPVQPRGVLIPSPAQEGKSSSPAWQCGTCGGVAGSSIGPQAQPAEKVTRMPAPCVRPSMVRCEVSEGVYLRSITRGAGRGCKHAVACSLARRGCRHAVALVDEGERELWRQEVEGKPVAVGGDTGHLFWAVTFESSPEHAGSFLRSQTWRPSEGGKGAPEEQEDGRCRRVALDSCVRVLESSQWRFLCTTGEGTLHLLDFSEGGESLLDVPVQVLLYSRFYGEAYGDYDQMKWKLRVTAATLGKDEAGAPFEICLRLGHRFCYDFQQQAWLQMSLADLRLISEVDRLGSSGLALGVRKLFSQEQTY